MPQSPLRPRVSVRDVLPILAAGAIITAAFLLSAPFSARLSPEEAQSLTLSSVGIAVALGVGLALAMASMQGRSAELTTRRALIAWLKLAIVMVVVALAAGKVAPARGGLRLGIVLIASLVASFVLLALRRPRA